MSHAIHQKHLLRNHEEFANIIPSEGSVRPPILETPKHLDVLSIPYIAAGIRRLGK